MLLIMDFSLFFWTYSIAFLSACSEASINLVYFFSGVKSKLNALSAMQPFTSTPISTLINPDAFFSSFKLGV